MSVVRVGRAGVFPARFTFVAAMNACPCGQHGSLEGVCSCPAGVPERYQRRISGPLRDRIDLWVVVDRVPPAALLAPGRPEPSQVVAGRIALAREVQRQRWGGEPNGRVAGRRLRAACGMDLESTRRATALADRERMSGRGTDRLLRVARTIADLDGAATVRPHHLDEAARFRAPADRGVMREAG